MLSSRNTLAAIAAAVFSAATPAQTNISGNLSGTIAPGVYHVIGTLTVPVNTTVTISAGAIFKFVGAHQVNVDGTLLCNGTAGQRIIFTDIQDDSAGGDTNGNGPSVGNWTAWRGMVFASTSSASVLNHVDARYGGSGWISHFYLNSASPAFHNCISRSNYADGMDLNGNSSPTVANCSFLGNQGVAVNNVPLMAVPGFTTNSASGNGGNYLRVTTATVSGALAIGPQSILNGALVMLNTIGIPPGASLTLQAGVVVKWAGALQVTVDGTLTCNGTAANPVVFTDFSDDSVAGDTNNNGASVGNWTAWRGIVFSSTSNASVLNHVDARYGGSGWISHFYLNSASPTFTNCISRNNFSDGMDLNGNSLPTVTNCTFTGNQGVAVNNVPLRAVPGFTTNAASGNGGNYMRITSAGVSGALAIAPQSILNGALVVQDTIGIPQGASLTLQAGVVVKWPAAYQMTVDGTLTCNGTSANPVVFTDFSDDSVAGDTNNNGASVGNWTAWRGIVFGPTSSASVLNHVDARYGGSGWISHFYLNSANPTFTNCISRNNFSDGMDLNGNSLPTVTNCTFTGNQGVAVNNVPLAAVPGFTTNTATGNAGNYMRVNTATVSGAVTIGPQSILNGALAMLDSITVAPGGSLTVQQGVIFKFAGGYQVTVNGAVDLRGTSYEPVVFTDFSDDQFGGDTNNNGPSVGNWTAWRGFIINAGAQPSRLENVRIRYTGSGFVPGLTCASGAATLRAVRVDTSYADGFELSAALGHPANLVAFGCGGTGFHLTGGSFDLHHATSAANSTGIRAETAWTGRIFNSISRGNGTNLANFGAGGQFRWSNGGFPGNNNNINVDPMFVNMGNGDLRLASGSPCLGAGDFPVALAVQKDHDEVPRYLSHALDTTVLPDMGAYERSEWDMAVGGAARPGHTITFTVNGPPGLSLFLLGWLTGTYPIHPYGLALAGGTPGVDLLLLYNTPIPVGTQNGIPLPNNPALNGLIAGIQSLTVPGSNFAVGQFTRMHRVLIRP